MEKAPLGTTAEYSRPSGAVRTEEGKRVESGSVGKHEWSFGKRGSGMTLDARGSRGPARTRKSSRQGRVTVDQCQQVEEEEDVDGHCDI